MNIRLILQPNEFRKRNNNRKQRESICGGSRRPVEQLRAYDNRLHIQWHCGRTWAEDPCEKFKYLYCIQPGLYVAKKAPGIFLRRFQPGYAAVVLRTRERALTATKKIKSTSEKSTCCSSSCTVGNLKIFEYSCVAAPGQEVIICGIPFFSNGLSI